MPLTSRFSRSLATFLVGTVLAACGSPGVADPADPEGYAEQSAPTEADRKAVEEEVSRVVAPLGEPSCGSTPADVTLVLGSLATPINSPNGAYDHPTCRNAYVVDIEGVQAGQSITAGTAPQYWPDPFTCLLRWSHASLWRKQPGGQYNKVIEDTRPGTWKFVWRSPFMCDARVSLPAVDGGDYKLIVSGGALFGPYEPVGMYVF